MGAGLYSDDAGYRRLGAINATVGVGSLVAAAIALGREQPAPRLSQAYDGARPPLTLVPAIGSGADGTIMAVVRVAF